MKKLIRPLAMLLTVCMLLGAIAIPAFAATASTATIDTTRTGSLTLYKYDFTSASNDGVWDDTYVSTGVYDETVNTTLGGGAASNLGNGQTSNGYAIKGVEFTYLKVADIQTYSGTDHTAVLYGIKENDALLPILGLTKENRFTPADATGIWYFESDVLVNAMRTALNDAPTATKSAMESYIKANGGTAMALTDADGKTSAADLPLGLYLLVETKVPEMVTNTINPFFVSVPMTSVNGNNATNGGEEWLYDITLYPKNETGVPTLEKTLRENKEDTGKNEGSDAITDGYAHTGTASAGDVIDYQIISKLPTITSTASYLSTYTFADTLSKGITYNTGDVKLTWYKDAACTDKITEWAEADGKCTVAYGTAADDAATMTITMTETGLAEINSADTVWGSSTVKDGYSDCYVRITYAATVNSDAAAVCGDASNVNDVMLTWKRTSNEYYDTLVDDCHLYTYGLDLTKTFSDGKGNFANVEFLLWNETDGYYVMAEQNAETGIYYVTDHASPAAVTDPGDGTYEALVKAAKEEAEKSATHFIPTAEGKIVVRGIEDDVYKLTEVKTDNGYVLLKDAITVTITAAESEVDCGIYGTDALGEVQNREAHKLLTASATVDGEVRNMTADGESQNAFATKTVKNTKGFNLPMTGELAARLLPLISAAVICFATGVIIVAMPKRNKQKEEN